MYIQNLGRWLHWTGKILKKKKSEVLKQNTSPKYLLKNFFFYNFSSLIPWLCFGPIGKCCQLLKVRNTIIPWVTSLEWRQKTALGKIRAMQIYTMWKNSTTKKPLLCSFSDQHEGQPGNIGSARCKIVEPDVTGPKSFSTWRTSTASHKIFSQRSAKKTKKNILVAIWTRL